jgi:glycosyltransferase involved in cell wall biosynthesis
VCFTDTTAKERECPHKCRHYSDEMRVMRALVVLPPAKTSHELEFLRAMPGWDISVVTGRGFGPDDADHHLASWRVPYLGSPERWTAALAWHRRLSQLDFDSPDLVVSLELHSPVSVQAARIARSLRVPHVVVIAETLADNPLYVLPPWRWFLRSLSRSAQFFVCLTERARRHTVELGCVPARCAVVHPGVNVHQYRPCAGGLPDASVMLFVGELRSDKGILDVIAACELVYARRNDLSLVVVGGGPLARRVAELAAARPFLEYLGPVARDRVPALMRDARALVVAPSHRRFWEEQFGFVYVEAMASGLPVVATRCGAIPEIVPSANALVAEGDLQALADAVERMAGPSAGDIGRTNRDAAVERYDITRQGHRLAEILGEVARAPLPSRDASAGGRG